MFYRITTILALLFTATALAQQSVTLEFHAQVGDQAAACGVIYEGVGAENSQIEFQDLRFYVSNLRLINATGEEVPLELAQDSQWQHENVALLDFEDGSALCAQSGNEAMNTQVTGTVPDDDYTGLVYNVGVPFDLNHADVATAPSPLNVSSMWWNWQGGYKHVRIDMMSHSAAMNMGEMMKEATQTQEQTDETKSESDTAEGHGDAASSEETDEGHGGATEKAEGGHGTASAGLWPFHLGSTGCVSDSSAVSPAAECTSPNVFEVRLDSFNPDKDRIIADISGLLSGVDLSQSLELAPPGCMSGADDPDCSVLFANLNLGGADTQTFFHSKTKE